MAATGQGSQRHSGVVSLLATLSLAFMVAGCVKTYTSGGTLSPVGTWRPLAQYSAGGHTFNVSIAAGTFGNTCYQVETDSPPVPSSSFDLDNTGCASGSIDNLETIVSIDPSYNPVYGLFVGATSSSVDRASVETTTGNYTADLSTGIAIAVYPPSARPIGVTVVSTDGHALDCSRPTALPFSFLVSCIRYISRPLGYLRPWHPTRCRRNNWILKAYDDYLRRIHRGGRPIGSRRSRKWHPAPSPIRVDRTAPIEDFRGIAAGIPVSRVTPG
jgi:hypothetical protein